MTPLVYSLTSDSFPQTGIIHVPCFSAASYDGSAAVLRPKGMTMAFDFSALTPDEVWDARRDQGRDVRVQGLAALETQWMRALPDVTFRPPYRKPLGVWIGSVWYYAWPLRWNTAQEVEEHTVVRLSN